MKKISFWAREHKWLSRILIILSIALLNAIGIIVGSLLYDLEIIISFAIFFLPVALYFSAFLYYPLKSDKAKTTAAKFYIR